MRSTILCFLLACVSFGQTATITYADGNTQIVPLVKDGQALCLMPRNTGRPDNWGQNWSPQPQFINSATMDLPDGYTILGGESIFGCVEYQPGSWSITWPGQFRYPVTRGGGSTIMGYGQSVANFTVDGGATFYMRGVPEADQWELATLTAITPAQKSAALNVLRPDTQQIARWPLLKKMVSAYTYDDSSVSVTTPAPARNVGWLMVPEHFMWRFPAQPGGLAAIRHPYGFGTRTPGGPPNNEHEYHDANFIQKYLLDGDLGALATGLYLIRWKVAYGLIDSDADNVWNGLWRNESGSMLRGTSGMAPSDGKCFDLGLCLGHVLLPNDPLLARGAAVRQARILGPRWSWQGGGGDRNLAHWLENCLDWYRATGNPALRARAEKEINHAFGIIGPTQTFFANTTTGGGTNDMVYSEGLTVQLAHWIVDEGVCPQHLTQLKAICTHMMSKIPASGRVPYKVNWTDHEGTSVSEVLHRVLHAGEVTFNGDWNGAWITALRPYAVSWGISTDAVFDQMEAYMFNKYPLSIDVSYYGSQGPGFEKTKGVDDTMPQMIFNHVEVMIREDGRGAHVVPVYRCCPPQCDNDALGHGCFFGKPTECRMYLNVRAAKEAWAAHECPAENGYGRTRHKHLHKKFRRQFIGSMIGSS